MEFGVPKIFRNAARSVCIVCTKEVWRYEIMERLLLDGIHPVDLKHKIQVQLKKLKF